MERIYATSTRLTLTPELKEYLNNYILLYNHVQRRVFQDIKHGIMDEMGRSKYVSYNDFIKRRDNSIYFLGAGCETCGNQMLQLYYHDDCFRMELSKDKPFRDKNKTITNNVQFSHMRNELTFAIQNHQPITYRISRKGRKWYLTAMFRIDTYVQTNNNNGVIGIDYNDGFLEAVETDESGNMISAQHIVLDYHGVGNKAESELKEKLSKLVRYALNSGKDIVVEDLDFKRKKSNCLKNGNKNYNKMIHLFDYHRYLFWVENLCLKYGVGFQKVNPAYTSQIGKYKYADTRKLTVHRAAAFVIARRGRGFEDKLTA